MVNTTITATDACHTPPRWAILERHLIDLMNQATQPFLDRYVTPEGELIWRDGGTGSRDGADDFYESVYNWPLFYLLGGADHLLHESQKIWDGITRQLTRGGMLREEYELGYDQFHQGESYIFFYFLCLADPSNPTNLDRAKRFAGFYLNEDPAAPNYDPEHRIIRAPHNGSSGPRWGTRDGDDPSYNWSPGMRVYGLPIRDISHIQHYDDLKDPAKAQEMGQAMQSRMGQGDVAGNLIATSLITNAYLLTGEAKYRDWVLAYTQAWIERAQANAGLLPDNVGLNGQVGESFDGKWYGGLYGWTWPHGYYNIGMAASVAGANAYLISRDPRYLDLPRSQYDYIWQLGQWRAVDLDGMSLRHHWTGQLPDDPDTQVFLVPYRYGDRVQGDQPGWFDYQPMSPVYPTMLWYLSQSARDWQRLETLRQHSSYDWGEVKAFRNKEDCGHEQAWLRYLAGDLPEYPEQILQASLANVYRRLALIAQDEADLTQVNIHHWQEHNPIVTEALLQLTLGAPQIIYNGGLLHARVLYFDADTGKPGLPQDVAALVENLNAEHCSLQLVNLSPFASRYLIIQAGAFAEHRFLTVQYSESVSDYPGSHKAYAAPPPQSTTQQVEINHHHLRIDLPPATKIRLELSMALHVQAARIQRIAV